MMAQTTSPLTIDWTVVRDSAVTRIEQLDAIFGEPAATSVDKESATMSALEIAFVQASPFYLLATSSPDGTCDVTPRGDPAGSVVVVDEGTLLLPDRRGNQRVDSLRNIVLNPHVGLLFLVPGIEETLRINGRVTITEHEPLRSELAMGGVVPHLALVVETEQVYMHCARAFRRSRLWQPEHWPATDDVPTMAAVLHDKLKLDGTVEDLRRAREDNYRRTLY